MKALFILDGWGKIIDVSPEVLRTGHMTIKMHEPMSILCAFTSETFTSETFTYVTANFIFTGHYTKDSKLPIFIFEE